MEEIELQSKFKTIGEVSELNKRGVLSDAAFQIIIRVLLADYIENLVRSEVDKLSERFIKMLNEKLTGQFSFESPYSKRIEKGVYHGRN